MLLRKAIWICCHRAFVFLAGVENQVVGHCARYHFFFQSVPLSHRQEIKMRWPFSFRFSMYAFLQSIREIRPLCSLMFQLYLIFSKYNFVMRAFQSQLHHVRLTISCFVQAQQYRLRQIFLSYSEIFFSAFVLRLWSFHLNRMVFYPLYCITCEKYSVELIWFTRVIERQTNVYIEHASHPTNSLKHYSSIPGGLKRISMLHVYVYTASTAWKYISLEISL